MVLREELVGEEINAVCFVMDYVEVRFNGPILRSLAKPTVQIAGKQWRFPAIGSRDALCFLIGAEVESVYVEEGSYIELRTKEGHVLTIPLDRASMTGPEAAHFIPDTDAPVQVW